MMLCESCVAGKGSPVLLKKLPAVMNRASGCPLSSWFNALFRAAAWRAPGIVQGTPHIVQGTPRPA